MKEVFSYFSVDKVRVQKFLQKGSKTAVNTLGTVGLLEMGCELAWTIWLKVLPRTLVWCFLNPVSNWVRIRFR